ncbi:MAG: OsmC family protein [Bacteroidetes bacterium]|nr:OsmC family protein [Bacteroidota bacterium]MCH8233512.1 OsmC family protein [Bacteroidota bacterium]
MPTIINEYQGSLRTRFIHLQSGNKLITDAPTDNNGKGESFSPTDLVAGALSACMLTIIGIKADPENIDLSGLRSEVTKVMAADPRRISEVQIDFFWENCTASDKQRIMLKKAALTCPVALSIHPDIKQDVKFHF